MVLIHYGIKRRSGRYPWGSGDRPYQSSSPMIEKGINKKKKLASDLLGRSMTRKQATSTIESKDPVNLKKGEKVQHIGVNFKGLREGQLYVTATDYDNKLYETFLSLNLKSKGFNPSKITLSLAEDLKAPSSKTQKDIFDNYYKKNKAVILDDLEKWAKSKGKELSGDLYDNFMNSLEMPSPSQKSFYKELKSKGYNAVLDEHDITGSWMQGKAPLIIMDQLATIGDYKIESMDTDKIVSAFDEWIKIKQ